MSMEKKYIMTKELLERTKLDKGRLLKENVELRHKTNDMNSKYIALQVEYKRMSEASAKKAYNNIMNQ